MEDKKYQKTVYSCFVGYIVQAIVNNFVPLLFLTFHHTYGIPLSQITFLVTINFAVQLLVDLISVKMVDRIGYRASLILAHAFSAVGLASLAFLPGCFSNSYIGILSAVILYAIGGGLLEVVVSPVMESCPTPNKEKAMSLLHSFYCWGHVGVVLLSTLFFAVFGIQNWRILALIWAIVPLANLIVVCTVPLAPLLPEDTTGMSLHELFMSKAFWIFILLMICAGACEQAVSQWASTFAEQGLHVSKTVGDLAGPMMFAILMGLSRMIYGKLGDKLPLRKCMFLSGALCLFSYLLISLSHAPILGLIGCGICGFSVGLFWPGSFSLASATLPRGGTAMFALLALAGDVGCSGGPTYVGLFASAFGDNLKMGILLAVIFPILLMIGVLAQGKSER
ncbi:MAG: MFS transporter [bacterium]|nr:MFS transporter [bacterium]